MHTRDAKMQDATPARELGQTGTNHPDTSRTDMSVKTKEESDHGDSPDLGDLNEYPGGMVSCLEAILIAADQPVQASQIAYALGRDPQAVEKGLEALREAYDNAGDVSQTGNGGDSDNHGVAAARPMGFELRSTVKGWQLVSRAVYGPVVSAVVSDGRSEVLSRAALEALAIIAYKQPVTRAQVAAIRGVNSDGVVRSLLVRGLIREQGVDDESRAALLVTSQLFLDRMGVDSLDDLPSLAPFMPVRDELLNESDPALG